MIKYDIISNMILVLGKKILPQRSIKKTNTIKLKYNFSYVKCIN